MTDFENSTPIDDPWTVLDLLYVAWGDGSRVDKWIDCWPAQWPKPEPCRVEVGYFCGGYTKDLHSKSYFFEITPEVVARLIASGEVAGEPQWGRTDMRKLRISEVGKHRLLERQRELGDFPRAQKWISAWKGVQL